MNKNRNENSVERIQRMEKCFDNAWKALNELRKALSDYTDVYGDIEKLKQYYNSKQWKSDYQADEEGKLPADLKRGVLSEDGIWDFLEENRELAEEMKETAEKMMK